MLRRLLAAYLHVEPRSIRLEQAEFGKPMLAPVDGARPLHFNASGSEGLALVALACEFEVGVDVERIRDIADSSTLARQLLPENAMRELEAAPATARSGLFLEHWVRHEALAKASGRGMRGIEQTTGIAVPLPAPREGFVAAVAASVPFDEIRCWSLENLC